MEDNYLKNYIEERKKVVDAIKEHEESQNFNQNYIRLNDTLASLSKCINNTLISKKFNYSRHNTFGNNYPSDYIVFDTETTGLDSNVNEIIEYTFLKYENNKLVDKLTSLVKPKNPIPPFITDITNITNDMVASSSDIESHLTDIINFINGSVIIGHNVLFDIKFLESAIKNASIELPDVTFTYLDTVSISRKCISDTPNHKLETLKEYFNIDTISHRSENDCEVTKIVYEKCVEMLINNSK